MLFAACALLTQFNKGLESNISFTTNWLKMIGLQIIEGNDEKYNVAFAKLFKEKVL